MPNIDELKNKAEEIKSKAETALEEVEKRVEATAGAAVTKAENLAGKDLNNDGVVGDGSGAETLAEKAQKAAEIAKDKAQGIKNAAEAKLGKDLDGDGKIG
ncbi:MAG: hypothetical protein IJV62_02660 [Eggerthellaceae bacterium]|nr:hypothetical protein [Eggerthellaceae bacterium]